ncbi:putative trypanothione synthetase [Trypanosoma rangeli]|uniref:Putative trypanothione synthetase n=1 Tax=Trypanosoma rangeli TaxID=5698 RepID=A0A3R7LYC7_TRYRA|nr:putative trypanothione synthetase [Trypanosoma rangeli]RNF05728.1 putative trypanothione synthetase [Trypanosoma rangeli]|eukprot:RNF05728.1 putative trypanothione synthetase [Trypanosoma rangeli]
MSTTGPVNLPFGALQGYAPGGIPAYSNKHDGYFSGERSIDGKLFCGFKYQCVEFARRWLFERKSLVLPDVRWAVHIFDLKEVPDARTARPVRCVAVHNSTKTKPVADALLIYPSADGSPAGHVAAITEVGDNWVRIADQNHRFFKWEGDYAAQLALNHENGVWTILDHTEDGVLNPLGWVTFPDTPDRDPSVPLVLHESLYFKPPEKLSLRRVTFTPKPHEDIWLDLTNEAEACFVKTYGMCVSRRGESTASYYEMNTELYLTCTRYGNQLHEFFLEATEFVLANDEQLKLFGIPEEYWPRIRHSWKTQPHAITGRFDFAFDEDTQQFKCFEYNADSASTLLECGTIQEKWAKLVGIDDDTTYSSGSYISSRLHMAWEMAEVKGRVHFLVDDDGEEQYTALYVLQHARAAGLDAKLCVLFDEFRFDENGIVVDADGVAVTTVWKTWMWETAIADQREARMQRGKDWRPTPQDKVRLSDIILGPNWDVRVFEPMWKLIPSNKAILPIIYNKHPDHPAMLRASYELTDELRRTGYAKKPIVGRVGRNVSIVEPSGEVTAESDGNFADRGVVYQELFRLPKRDDYYAILGGWIIGDVYCGTNVREDKTIITGLLSPVSALRVLSNPPRCPLTHEDLDDAEKAASASA